MALEGSLHDMPLVDLIRVSRIGSKSGALYLRNGGTHGQILFSQGQVVDAELFHAQTKRLFEVGEEAVLRMFDWDDAYFVFSYDPRLLNMSSRLVRDSAWFIDEGMRRRANRVVAGSDQSIDVTIYRANTSALDSLEAVHWRMFSIALRFPLVRDICVRAQQEDNATVKALNELASIGAIAVIGKAYSPAAEVAAPVVVAEATPAPAIEVAPAPVAETTPVAETAPVTETAPVADDDTEQIDAPLPAEQPVAPMQQPVPAAQPVVAQATPPTPPPPPDQPRPRLTILQSIIRRIRGL